MKKEKLILTALVSSAVLCVALSFTGKFSTNALYADTEEQWSHYSAVADGLNRDGIKEYWVSCTSHEHQFTAPTVSAEHIVDKGAPTQDFIDSLPLSDDRLVPTSYRTLYDFENGLVPSVLVGNSLVKIPVISDTDGVDGSKCLDVPVRSGDFMFGLSKDCLDLIFEDTSVNAIAFDAKSTVASQNWRYGTPGGPNGATQPFEHYANGDGINTNWKTFYFTRDMYDAWTDGSYMIKGSTGDAHIYIDNVRTTDTDLYTHRKSYGFETSGVTDASDTSGKIRVPYSNKVLFKAEGAGVVANSGSMDYSIKSEGNRSFHFTKQNGYIAVYMETSIVNAIPGDYVLLDMYSTVGINSYDNNKGITDGSNGAFNRQTPANKWFTLVLNKSTQITNDGRILTLSGSAAGDIYFDNIRGLGSLDDFETAYAFKAGQYGYALDYKTDVTEAAGGTIRDTNKNYTFLVNGAGCSGAEITTEKASSGHHSLKISWSAKGYCALSINPNLLNTYLPAGFSVSFDIWVSGSFTGGTFIGNAVNNHVGSWTTVTLEASNFEYDSGKNSYNGRFSTANYNQAGEFYLDNFKLIAPAA